MVISVALVIPDKAMTPFIHHLFVGLCTGYSSKSCDGLE